MIAHGFIPTGNASPFTELSINFSSTGANAVIAGIANQTIRVFRLFLVTSAATDLTIYNGATALTGPMSMEQSGGITLDWQHIAWFTTSAGNAFVISQDGSAIVGGRIYFQQS